MTNRASSVLGAPSRAELATCLAIVVTVCSVGFALGYVTLSSSWASESLASGGLHEPPSPLTIATRNLSCSFLLYSGALTLGITTLCGSAMVSVYVGATMFVGVTNSGWHDLTAQTACYLPLEFGGLILAATAGVSPPVLAALRSRTARDQGFGTARVYASALAHSLQLYGVGFAMILAGAAVEGALIALR